MNQRETTLVQSHTDRVIRATTLKTAVLAALNAPETVVSAAIAARLLTEAFTLNKAIGDSVLVLRHLDGENLRLPMLLQMSTMMIPREVLSEASPSYIESVAPFADRLLDAAEAHLKGERVSGDEPDICCLSDFRTGASAVTEGTMEFVIGNNDADKNVLKGAAVAGWIAADVSDLSASADSVGSTWGQDESLEAAISGRLEGDSQELRRALDGVPADVLIGEAMGPYHKVIVPLIAELAAVVQATLPEELTGGGQDCEQQG